MKWRGCLEVFGRVKVWVWIWICASGDFSFSLFCFWIERISDLQDQFSREEKEKKRGARRETEMKFEKG